MDELQIPYVTHLWDDLFEIFALVSIPIRKANLMVEGEDIDKDDHASDDDVDDVDIKVYFNMDGQFGIQDNS